MMYDYIVWDWNGTLADDVLFALESVNMILRKRKLGTINLEQYRSYIDTPIIKFYEHILDLSTEDFSSIADEFHTGYDTLATEMQLNAGARELLEYFMKKDCKQFIVSAAEEKKIIPHLKRLEIDGFFDAVSGADDLFAGSKIERAKTLLFRSGVSVKSGLLIGDSLHDAATADALGLDCILTCQGHQMREDLQRSSAEVVDSLSKKYDEFNLGIL